MIEFHSIFIQPTTWWIPILLDSNSFDIFHSFQVDSMNQMVINTIDPKHYCCFILVSYEGVILCLKNFMYLHLGFKSWYTSYQLFFDCCCMEIRIPFVALVLYYLYYCVMQVSCCPLEMSNHEMKAVSRFKH